MGRDEKLAEALLAKTNNELGKWLIGQLGITLSQNQGKSWLGGCFRDIITSLRATPSAGDVEADHISDARQMVPAAMPDVVVVSIGAGEIISNWGTYYDLPAVFLQPVPGKPGKVGEKPSRDFPKDSVPPGTVILQFKGEPDVLLQDIAAALSPTEAQGDQT